MFSILAFTLRLRLSLAVVVAVSLAATGNAFGQRPQPPNPLPDRAVQVMLVRNTLTLVNHSNLTGNYTVLRDLASDAFRQRNTAADLAAAFAPLRTQKSDLSPILVIDPQLTRRPSIDDQNRLVLAGYIPTQPQQVQFAIAFQQVRGGWVVDDVSVRVAALQRPANSPQQLPATPPR